MAPGARCGGGMRPGPASDAAGGLEADSRTWQALTMRCAVTLKREGNEVVARCREFPGCEGRASTTSEALARLRAGVVFWLEACPCDQTADHGLELEVVEDASGP